MCIEPSEPLGDAPCPHCGSLLWFIAVGDDTRFFDPNQPGLVEKIAERLGVDPEALREGRWEELGIDSLDLCEVMMEFDEPHEN